jgi:rhamnogalacturonyl hydrolase YesR
MIVHVKENLAHQMKTGNQRKANGALYGWWTWIDAIQMAMPVYSKMYRITGEQKYIDHAMRMYTWSRDTLAGGLFNVKEGLWWRDKDYVAPYTTPDGKNCYWSRGNGWVYAALVRCMNLLSPKDKYYKQLKKDFLLMSEALKNCQRPEDGLWNPSLVSYADYGGKEMSGTALFLYGMSWGIQKGYLKAKDYKPVCDRAWEGLVRDCVHPDGFLGWAQGTGKDPSAGQPLSYTKVPDFEDYGTGCFLLGGVEYYKLVK